MFDWFRKPTIEEYEKAVEDFAKKQAEYIPPVPEVKPAKSEEDKLRDHAFYTVGSTMNGDVVLKVHSSDGYGTTTLTMNPSATRQLIAMLGTALGEYGDNNDPTVDVN